MLVGNVQLIAGTQELIPQILSLLEKEGIAVQGNPDIYTRTYTQFGIGEARELRERAGLRAQKGSRRVFIIVAPGMTVEAQNALLKTLEEPPADALFFFIIPAPQTLLATVRSRAQVLALPHKEVKISNQSLVDAEVFVRATPQKRLDMLQPLLEKDEDDKRDTGAILEFLASLEHSLEKKPEGLHAVYRARKYIGDKGALVKPLLEQVALLV